MKFNKSIAVTPMKQALFLFQFFCCEKIGKVTIHYSGEVKAESQTVTSQPQSGAERSMHPHCLLAARCWMPATECLLLDAECLLLHVCCCMPAVGCCKPTAGFLHFVRFLHSYTVSSSSCANRSFLPTVGWVFPNQITIKLVTSQPQLDISPDIFWVVLDFIKLKCETNLTKLVQSLYYKTYKILVK